MKRLLMMVLLLSGSSTFAGILDIKYPSTICPTDNPKLTVDYNFYFNVFGYYPREEVIGVKWQFLQNGAVFKTLNSSSFDRYTPPGSVGQADIYAGALRVGIVTVKVTITTAYHTGNGFYFKTYTYSENINVGIKNPTSITGPTILCPGETGTYSTPALANATSYTWEVPSDWYVNGLPGPVVADQERTVDITAGLTSFTTNTVGVTGVSNTCGTTSPFAIQVDVDYPFTIDERNLSQGAVRLSVEGNSMDSYFWQLPPAWTLIEDRGRYIDFYPNATAGTASVTVLTRCGTTATKDYRYELNSCNTAIQVYPTSVVDYITVDPGELSIIDMAIIDDYGNTHTADYTLEGSIYRVNATYLPVGLYNLRIQTPGCIAYFRFSKGE